MKELSPYGHIDAPHLHDTFISKRGRFQLVESHGRVLLEGTTWYIQKLAPDWYWSRITGLLIHRIHMRVLEHIKRQAESPALDPGSRTVPTRPEMSLQLP